MGLIQDKCIEYNEKRPICTASENGKTYRLYNVSNFKIRKVKIDKCIPQGPGEKRCDYLFNTETGIDDQAFFVELKGGGLSDAVKQLHQTIIFLKGEFKNYKLNARIVGSKDVPEFANIPGYKKLKELVKATKGTLERATNKFYSENI